MPRSPKVPRLLADAAGRATLSAAGMAMLLAANLPAAAQQAGGSFRDGPCSGVLCGYIGGSQAPAAPQTSLFREGECGGVLCDTIGGPQAPKRRDPPPACGGGLLCDLMPYQMGAPVTAAAAPRGPDAAERQLDPAPAAKPGRRRGKLTGAAARAAARTAEKRGGAAGDVAAR